MIAHTLQFARFIALVPGRIISEAPRPHIDTGVECNKAVITYIFLAYAVAATEHVVQHQRVDTFIPQLFRDFTQHAPTHGSLRNTHIEPQTLKVKDIIGPGDQLPNIDRPGHLLPHGGLPL
ncbi:hypothetical protein D3C73_714860 [compost metagenome]